MRAMKANPESTELMEMFNSVSIEGKIKIQVDTGNYQQFFESRNAVFVISEDDLLTGPHERIEKELLVNFQSTDTQKFRSLLYFTPDFSPLLDLDPKKNPIYKLIV